MIQGFCLKILKRCNSFILIWIKVLFPYFYIHLAKATRCFVCHILPYAISLCKSVLREYGFFINSKVWFMSTAHKMKFSSNNFFSQCDEICSFLRIWSHSLKKYLMENFILCVLKADSNLIKNTGNIQIESFPTMINRIMKSVFVFLYLYQPWEHLCFYYIWWNCNTNTSN